MLATFQLQRIIDQALVSIHCVKALDFSMALGEMKFTTRGLLESGKTHGT